MDTNDKSVEGVAAMTMPAQDLTHETVLHAQKKAVEAVARRVAASTFYGALLGLTIGGIGGRLAMRLLFLTSSETVRGLTSDDGFIIGRFSPGDTFTLLVFGTLIGILGGLIYLGLRRWLPRSTTARRLSTAFLAGCLMGAFIIHPDGVDFTALEPLWLAVALFVAIPALFGFAISALIDRADQPGSWFQAKPARVALAPLVVFVLPPILVFGGIPVAITLLLHRAAVTRPSLTASWESPQIQLGGRAMVAVIAVGGLILLVRDILAL